VIQTTSGVNPVTTMSGMEQMLKSGHLTAKKEMP
jgi:hypothetical protein